MYQKSTKNVLKNLGRALEIAPNDGTAFASQKPQAALSSLPLAIKFYHLIKGLYLLNFV